MNACPFPAIFTVSKQRTNHYIQMFIIMSVCVCAGTRIDASIAFLHMS